MNPLKSRKSMIATIASIFAAGLATFATTKGWVPPDKSAELVEAVMQAILAIWGVVVLGISVEDGGRAAGGSLPAPPATPPVKPSP